MIMIFMTSGSSGLVNGCHVYAIVGGYVCRTDQACSRRIDHCLIPSVSMPLPGVGLLLERHEHGTQKPGTPTIKFSLEGPLARSTRDKILDAHLIRELNCNARHFKDLLCGNRPTTTTSHGIKKGNQLFSVPFAWTTSFQLPLAAKLS